MDWYYNIALTAILLQIVFLFLCYRNYRYALAKYKRKRTSYRPYTALIVPCKGLDSDFQKNIASFFNQDYENFLLYFVVADKTDRAYTELCKLKDQLSSSSKARDIQVFIAGHGQSCSQKIHNLLCCYRKISDDIEVLAFADSDICIRSDWLSHIVYPLRKPKNGVATGYRWFIPQKNNLATLALSAGNAKIAQLLGPSRLNLAWGGSMAIRVDVFRRLGLHETWPKAISDDLSLSHAVKKAGLRIVFVPACLAPSHQKTNWLQLFEFTRRQFLITRVTVPRSWWIGLVGGLYSVLGLWAGAAIAIYAALNSHENWPLFATVPILFFTGQLWRSGLRQRMVSKLLREYLPQMKFAIIADVLAGWIWSPILLSLIISSGFGRTICWRGIRYKLLGPTETVVLEN
ncbi:MAG: glycosyltransferase family 2 protein [Planctomycetota bacterium]|jgi:cellulose synthase/poly-beta-1,6-N-acetylglucosamine synthase-like glycosyltransferase